MNLKEIKEIIQLMNDHALSEIEIEREGIKLKIRKTGSGGIEYVSSAPRLAPLIQEVTANRPQEAAPAVPVADHFKEIVSPMVGTFYRTPSPEAPPFIDVGQIVEVGQVVCIVEAMKLMNEIKSEIRGRVAEVAVENAEPVEFGQVLFRIEPV